jgi:thioredoxin 1
MSILHVTKDNFEKLVLDAKVPVLLDFWASWCGPCRMIAPVLEELCAENDTFLIGKINVDEEPELAEAFAVVSIPTLSVVKNKKETARAVGFRQKAEILELLNG